MGQLRVTAQGTAAATSVVLRFKRPGQYTAWQGTVSVPTSPTSASWVVMLTGVALSTIAGTSGYGPIVVEQSEVLSLVGTGVVSGVQYSATLVGAQVPLGTTSVPIPTPAVAPSLAGAGLYGTGSGIKVAHTVGGLTTEVLAAGTYHIWSWGVHTAATRAKMARLIIFTSAETLDALNLASEASSNRPAGILVTGIVVIATPTTSTISVPITKFVLYSLP